jgi:excisionase family DNA binding protein
MEIIDAKEAAKRLGCSPGYVRRLVRAGRVKATKLPGGWAIEADSVEKEKRRREDGGK